MNKFKSSAIILVASVLVSTGVSAEGSMQNFANSAQNIKQSALYTAGSVGNGVVGSAKLVSGVAALPFKAIGSVTAASNSIGDLLWDNATGQEALEVSDKAVTAGPAPMVAMNN